VSVSLDERILRRHLDDREQTEALATWRSGT
jgi:hypothetical protein